MKKRNLGIDAVKIFACVMVVFMHTFRQVDASVSLHPFFYYFTRCSMPLFFMASGFIQLGRQDITFRYCIKKIASILTVVFAWTGLYTLLRFILERTLYFPKDMFLWVLQQGKFSVFWFFGAMILLYLLLVPLTKLMNHGRLSVAVFIGLLLICVSIDAFNVVNISRGADFFVQMYIPQPLRLWTWLFYFTAGGFIARYGVYKKGKLPIWGLATAVLSVLAVLYLYGMLKVKTQVVNGEYLYDSLVVMLWSAAVFCTILRINWDKPILERGIRALTKTLVPVYAMHYILLTAIVGKTDWFVRAQIPLALAVFAFCAAVGYGMSKLPVVKRLTYI